MSHRNNNNKRRENFRDFKKPEFRDNNRGPREMFDAKCSDCGQDTQVPFQPTEGKPVYCKDCYQNHRKPRAF